MLCNTWNTSVRIIFNLNYATHRYFIQPVSNKIHLKNILMKRFLGFLTQIEKSAKKLPLRLLQLVRADARSTTGSNLRKIMVLLGKHSIDEVKSDDIDTFEYAPVKPEDAWKIDMVKELIEVRENQASIENFTRDELEEILEHVCIS